MEIWWDGETQEEGRECMREGNHSITEPRQVEIWWDRETLEEGREGMREGSHSFTEPRHLKTGGDMVGGRNSGGREEGYEGGYPL